MIKMKNSGVEWIGEIPDEWEVSKIGQLYEERRTKVSDTVYPPLSVTMQGILPQLETAAKSDAHDDRKLVLKGDFAINSRSDRRGSCGISEFDGSVSLINTVLHPKTEMNPIYYNWLFHSFRFSDEYYKNGHGIVDDLWTTSWSEMKRIFIPLPPKSIQQHIASYLDKKCSKIEETIQNQQQVIEKLKNYKQSLITEAVTGKIKIQNGKVCGKYQSYKDSGVEWIGKIPSEWSCVQIKNIFRFLGGYAFNSEDYVDETEYQILRIGNVKDFKILFDSSPAYISKETALKVENFKLKAGYILFTMTGTRGKKDYFYTHKVTDADCTKKNIYLNQRVGCLIPNSNISSSYFNYLLKDNLIKDSVFLSETGTANQANIGSDDVMRIKLHCPPKEEQKEIADYLDKKCTAIDTAIEQKQKLIKKLTEYKKSLIYECVTGKKGSNKCMNVNQ